MLKCVVMHELAVVKGSKNPKDIYLVFEEQDLSSENSLTEGIIPMDLVSFFERTKSEKNMIKGNFYMDKALPRLLNGALVPQTIEADSVGDYWQSKIEPPEITVIEIMRQLSEYRSIIKFEEHFYNKMSGGAVFDDFQPNFDTARITADNLIISGKKFNIVLTATIDGIVDMNGATQIFSRFHPFKLVKFGKLVHDSIKVKIDDNNEQFLQRVSSSVNEEWATINLTEFPIFHTTGATPTLDGVYTLLDKIHAHKAMEKAYKFYLTKLKEKIPSDLLDTKEWFRGEPVDDDYISDEGTEYFEVWIKGQQKIISVDKLLSVLPDLGDSFSQLFTLFSDLEEIDLNHFEELFGSLETIVNNYSHNNTINLYETVMLRSLIGVLKIKGNRLDRYKHLVKVIKQNSRHLNTLELKLLNFRWNLYKMSPNNNLALNDSLMKLGEYEGQRKNLLNLSHFADNSKVVVFKKDIIERSDRNPNFTSIFDEVTPIISTDVEGV